MSHETVNTYSLLYRVQGTDSSLQPYLLAAHLDVVPAPTSGWEVPPFDGVVDDKFIWGRGTLDFKDGVMVGLGVRVMNVCVCMSVCMCVCVCV